MKIHSDEISPLSRAKRPNLIFKTKCLRTIDGCHPQGAPGGHAFRILVFDLVEGAANFISLNILWQLLPGPGQIPKRQLRPPADRQRRRTMPSMMPMEPGQAIIAAPLRATWRTSSSFASDRWTASRFCSDIQSFPATRWGGSHSGT